VSDLVFLHCNLQKVRTEKHKHPPTQVGKKHFVHAQVLLAVQLFYTLLPQGSALNINVWMPSSLRQRTGPKKEAGKILQKLMGKKAGSQSMRCQM
jgi:hypothetical protein